MKVQSLLPRKLNGIATATAIAWAAEFAHPRARPAAQHDQVDHQAGDADGEEAGRLQVGEALPRAEGPVAVPEEVAGDGDAEGADRGDRVVDAEVAGEEGEDAEVDQVAGAADDAELEQLDPVVAAAGGAGEADREAVLRRRSCFFLRAARGEFVRGRGAGVLAEGGARGARPVEHDRVGGVAGLQGIELRASRAGRAWTRRSGRSSGGPSARPPPGGTRAGG